MPQAMAILDLLEGRYLKSWGISDIAPLLSGILHVPWFHFLFPIWLPLVACCHGPLSLKVQQDQCNSQIIECKCQQQPFWFVCISTNMADAHDNGFWSRDYKWRIENWVHLRPGSRLENGPQENFSPESLGTSGSHCEFNMATLVRQAILAPATRWTAQTTKHRQHSCSARTRKC